MFAWSFKEMTGLNPKVTIHCLSTFQKGCFTLEVATTTFPPRVGIGN